MSIHVRSQPPPIPTEPPASGDGPVGRFASVRGASLRLAAPLSPEDCAVQSMPEASPTKWHLAHTTWFFEAFLLRPFAPGYRPFHERFSYLFNSYYNALGDRHPRPQRGLLTRPSLQETLAYRRHVDQHMAALIEGGDAHGRAATLIEIGLQHEQQHQELILTDMKHLLACNPLRPAYQPREAEPSAPPWETRWVRFEEGVRWIGHAAADEAASGDGRRADGGSADGFAYDNESPRHRAYVDAFEIADRLVTNGEYLAFIADGGYERPELWLDEGWATVQAERWSAPLYWERDGEAEMHRGDAGAYRQFTLAGERPLDPHEPVCHVSFFEADAFARWAGARLATEAEWETACAAQPVAGNFAESELYHPAGATPEAPPQIRQCFGDVWEWTRSQYGPYPGYRPPDGALGEYNGKFMCNQFVLRGGSCATPCSHVRPTYRNFFPPAARWQFTGIRLARDA